MPHCAVVCCRTWTVSHQPWHFDAHAACSAACTIAKANTAFEDLLLKGHVRKLFVLLILLSATAIQLCLPACHKTTADVEFSRHFNSCKQASFALIASLVPHCKC